MNPRRPIRSVPGEIQAKRALTPAGRQAMLREAEEKCEELSGLIDELDDAEGDPLYEKHTGEEIRAAIAGSIRTLVRKVLGVEDDPLTRLRQDHRKLMEVQPEELAAMQAHARGETPSPMPRWPELPRPQTLEEPKAWLARVINPEAAAQLRAMRGPYMHHKDHLELLEWVFVALSQPMPRGGLTLLHCQSGIPSSTLWNWQHVLEQIPSWRPSRKASGDAKRVFTDEEEFELMSRVNMKYLDPQKLCSDGVFTTEANCLRAEVQLRLEMRAATDPSVGDRYLKILKFRASSTFVAAFRKRHDISLRRPAYKRRPAIDMAALQAFIERIQQILRELHPDRVINIDETNWKIVNGAFLTWAKRGTESVQCHIEDDEKAGVTAIGAIDAAGQKLPLTVIGKGKTPRCLVRYQLGSDVFKLTSESGWTTTDVMCRYLEWLRESIFPSGEFVVILDTYPAHRAPLVKAKAAELGIRLEFIPPGCTDLLQPLDRRVFGVLKSYGREQWASHYQATGGKKTTRAEMAASLVKAWDRITPDVLEKAWNIYWDENGPDAPVERDDPNDTPYIPSRNIEDYLDEP